MAITIDNKTYRNLEEQVLKNKEDIARHYEIDRVLSDWGIKVLGVYASADLLPTENNEFGDAYAVGVLEPYTYYIWTRANTNVGQETDYWLNVGALSIVGPQGPQGRVGPIGPQGVRGSKWFSGTVAPTYIASLHNINDMYINGTNGDVYQLMSNNVWQLFGNIKGPQGVQGAQGIQGVPGSVGPYGPQGPKGDTGSQYIIAGNLESIDLLPTPTEANRHQAYGVKNANNGYDLYLIIGTNNLVWFNYGPITAAQGAQGPTGAQGPMGQSQEVIDTNDWVTTYPHGIVPEEYRDEQRLANAILKDSDWGYYRNTGYADFDNFGSLIFINFNNDDSGTNSLVFSIFYIYSDWSIEKTSGIQLLPIAKTAQIIDDQGKLELVTYDTRGDTIDINESPNQFLQRNLNSPSVTLTNENNYQGIENLTEGNKYICYVAYSDDSGAIDTDSYAVMNFNDNHITFGYLLSKNVWIYQNEFIVINTLIIDRITNTAKLSYRKISDSNPYNEYELSISIWEIKVF